MEREKWNEQKGESRGMREREHGEGSGARKSGNGGEGWSLQQRREAKAHGDITDILMVSNDVHQYHH